MAQKILVILNPSAGQGDPESLRKTLEASLDEASSDWEWEIRETTGAGDCSNWAGTAGGDGWDRIVAVGGDGTVAEAAEGLLRSGSDLPLAIVPRGTANVLAEVIDVPADPADAIRLALSGDSRGFDVGFLPELDRYFLVGLGVGIPAQTVENADREAKDRFGFGAYLGAFVEGLIENRTAVLDLEIDGESVVAPGQSAVIANLGEMDVLGLTLAEGISPHDRALDLFVIDHTDPGAVLEGLKRILKGGNRTKTVEGFLHRRAKSIRISTNPPLSVQADGEWIGRTPVVVEIAPSPVQLVIGPDYH